MGTNAKPLPGQRIVSLAKEKSKPLENFNEYHWLIYGERKIGKTTLAAEFEDTIFLMTEPGGKDLEIYQNEVKDWQEFRAYVNALGEDKDYKTVVVDTVDILYEMCMHFVCQKSNIDHPGGQNDYGRSWALVKNEFALWVNKLMRVGKGIVFISHAKIEEVAPRVGAKFSKIAPTMKGQAYEVIYGAVDIIAYYTYFGNDRRLIIRGNELVGAGNRLTRNFLTQTEPRKQIQSIRMGTSSREGYFMVKEAFRNETDFVGDDVKLTVDAAMPSANPMRR